MTEKGSRELISGFVAGIVSRTVTNPLERLKTIRQLSVSEFQNMNIYNSFKWIYKHQGLKGFFQGNLANCIKIGPFSSIEFQTYTLYKNSLLKEKTFGGTLLCGSLSGATASIFTYPLDQAKTHLSIQTNESGQNKTIFKILNQTQKAEGVRGLQKGCLASCYGIGPFIAIKMSTNDQLRDQTSKLRENKNIEFMINFSNGALSGMLAAICTHPTDLVRKLIQVQDLNNPIYTGFFNAFYQVQKTEGIKGLFKGLVPNVLKCAPTFGIAFMVNEYLKTLLGVKQRI